MNPKRLSLQTVETLFRVGTTSNLAEPTCWIGSSPSDGELAGAPRSRSSSAGMVRWSLIFAGTSFEIFTRPKMRFRRRF